MRENVTREKLQRFMRELARQAKSSGSVFFTGGSTALLLGLREQTIDVDLRLDPEPAGAFEALAKLKNALDINVELASPADFIPVANNWRDASQFIANEGSIAFFHFDLRAQILSKIERGLVHDINDARAFLQAGRISPDALWSHFLDVRTSLLRYPAIDPARFEAKVKDFIEQL